MKEQNLLFDYCFLNFFSHLQNLLKISVYTHPIELSCHQKFEKIHRPEAEILAHKVGKYENVTVN